MASPPEQPVTGTGVPHSHASLSSGPILPPPSPLKSAAEPMSTPTQTPAPMLPLEYLSAYYAPLYAAYYASQQAMVPPFGYFSHTTQPAPTHVSALACRNLFLGGLPSGASIEDLCNLVTQGPLDAVRLLPEKQCGFLDFVEEAHAIAFVTLCQRTPPRVQGTEIRVEFAKGSPLRDAVRSAVQTLGASRCLYVGPSPAAKSSPGAVEAALACLASADWLRRHLGEHSPVEHVRCLKGFAFVHFASISAAMAVLAKLSLDPAWRAFRLGYGRDRCAGATVIPDAPVAISVEAPSTFTGPTLSLGSSFAVPAAPNSSGATPPTRLESPLSTSLPLDHSTPCASSALPTASSPHDPLLSLPGVPSPFTQHHRNVFIGGLPPRCEARDLSRAIRGGNLFSLRVLTERCCAFVSFVDARDALSWYARVVGPGAVVAESRLVPEDDSHHAATYQSPTNISERVPGLHVRGRHVYRIGFAKPNHVSDQLLGQIRAGARRNLCLAFGPRFNPSEAQLRRDFERFGQIESVVFVLPRALAFVNFTAVPSAIRALTALPAMPDYKGIRASYGHDACAGPMPADRDDDGHRGRTSRPNRNRSLSRSPSRSRSPNHSREDDRTGSDGPISRFTDEAIH